MNSPAEQYGKNIYLAQTAIIELLSIDRPLPEKRAMLGAAVRDLLNSIDDRLSVTAELSDVHSDAEKHRYATAWIVLKDYDLEVRVTEGMITCSQALPILSRLISCLYIFAIASKKCINPCISILIELGDTADFPSIGFCSADEYSVLVPDHYFVTSLGYAEFRHTVSSSIKWEERSDKIFWRGSTTGFLKSPIEGRMEEDIRHLISRLPRLELCYRLKNGRHTNMADVGITNIVQIYDQDTIEMIKRSGITADPIAKTEFGRYKYVVDIDGNGNAWNGLFESLLLGCCVLKVQSPDRYRQWYYHKLRPWKNIVPISATFEDLDDVIDLVLNDQKAAATIASEGRGLSAELTFDREITDAAERIAIVMNGDECERQIFSRSVQQIFKGE